MNQASEALCSWLLRERPAWQLHGVALLLALAMLAHLYPLSFLAGQGLYFEGGDAAQHASGWQLFAQDAWRWPLLHTERLNHPQGVSIAFTDSIPLAALLLKPFADWLPRSFHYIGAWHALVYLGQALAAVFLLRVLGLRHLLATIAAVVLALCWPALLWRVGHSSLMTHALILLALAFYLLGRRGSWSARRITLAFAALSLAALTIHPYLLAFCASFYLALLAGRMSDRTLPRGPLLAGSVAWLATLGLAAWALGYFSHGASNTAGFGQYSMNLNAPFCGRGLLRCAVTDATGGQYEGFNHLGAGLLLLLPFALALAWRQRDRLLRRHGALLLALLALTLYALSNRVYFGADEWLSYPLPSWLDRLTGTFRASGRFFWPVGYVLLFATLALLLRQLPRLALPLLALALPLQWIDVAPLRAEVQLTASRPARNDLPPWSGVLADVHKIHLLPTFGCQQSPPRPYWLMQRLAAHYGSLLDTGYIARPQIDCEANFRTFQAPFVPHNLYVMHVSQLLSPRTLDTRFASTAAQGGCAQWSDLVLCRSDYSAADWARASLPTQPLGLSDFATMRWPGATLWTESGIDQNDRMVPYPAASPGLLSFGPHVALAAGHYRYRLDYASAAAPDTAAGEWDATLGSGSPAPRTLASGALRGTAGRVAHIGGDIMLPEDSTAAFDIRTRQNAGHDLQIVALTVERRGPPDRHGRTKARAKK